MIAIRVAALLVLLAVSVEAHRGKPGGGNTLFPVTAALRCPLGLDCYTPDAFQGDSLGPYRGTTPSGSMTTQEGLSSNVGAYFTEGNLFLFVLKPGFGRFAHFDLSTTAGAPPCAATGSCRKNFTIVVTDESLPGSRTYPVDAIGTHLPNGFLTIPIGSTAAARMFLNFDDPSGRELLWTLRFDPILHPGSTLLSVTRESEGLWAIEAGPNHIAGLMSSQVIGKASKVNEGYYRMPFRIAVSR